VHDAEVLPQLLHGMESEIVGDAAYQSKEASAMAQAAGIEWKVCERGSRNKALTARQKRSNREISSVRAYVEHPYLVVKHLWGHVKVRYRGISKNLAQAHMLYGLANLFMQRHRLMA
jgi:transposase, IS5 family